MACHLIKINPQKNVTIKQGVEDFQKLPVHAYTIQAGRHLVCWEYGTNAGLTVINSYHKYLDAILYNRFAIIILSLHMEKTQMIYFTLTNTNEIAYGHPP